MKTLIIRASTFFIWIGITIVCAVLYGIVNDQITATISPEYYTVYKHRQFTPQLEAIGLLDAPMRVQAVLIGTLSTWWYGLFLGIMLGISSMVGSSAPLSTIRYIHMVGLVMLSTFAVSVIFGVVAYITEPFTRPSAITSSFLTDIQDIRSAYVVGNWHNGSYLAAFPATIYAGFLAQRLRRKLALADNCKDMERLS